MILENNWFLTALICVNALLIYRLYTSQLWTMLLGKPKPTSPIAYKTWTLEELHQYNGVDNPRILLAIKGLVYDVTDKGSSYYGPGTEGDTIFIGGSYHVMAGEDASLALATLRLPSSKTELRSTGYDLSNLSEKELDVLEGWVRKFESKYVLVGKLD